MSSFGEYQTTEVFLELFSPIPASNQIKMQIFLDLTFSEKAANYLVSRIFAKNSQKLAKNGQK